MHDLRLGLDTFGDTTVDLAGNPVSQAQVIRDVVEQGVLADQVGIDAFNLGEHHRPDFAVSSPEMVLAGIASRTSRIRLGSAVTVLSSDDPVRVYQRFATLDAIASGRAQITVGRGSFTESFPLFGFELNDYHELFEEKLDLLAQIRHEGEVTWSGTMRAPLALQHIYPKTDAGTVPIWVGVGGSPDSVVRTARHSLPMILAIIGGDPGRFLPIADLFRRATSELGTGPLPIGVHSPGFIADTDDEARELLYPHFKHNRDSIGAERGWPPVSRMQYDAEIDHGSLYVGSPETVARKMADTITLLGLDRFDLKYSHGPMPHEHSMRCIELYGTQVIPMVREMVAQAS